MNASPQDVDVRAADRQVLRQILADIEAGINERDLQKILRHLSDEVVVTYQNADVSRGKAEVSDYFNVSFNPTNPIIKRFTIHGEVAAPAVFAGDVAIAHGTTHDEMELATGRKFSLDGKWSATILNERGAWRVALLHFSTNVLDNSVLNGAKRLIWIGAAGGLVLGAVIAWLLARVH